MNYKISHPHKSINCEINLPSSKSISNRLLIIQAICNNNFKINNLSKSEDTKKLVNALKQKTESLDLGNSGTTLRFLTAFFSLKKNREIILTGSKRMKKRPIKDLVDALLKIGANISYLEAEGFPPIKIKGTNLNGGKIKINGDVSSQFISAILLVAPLLKDNLELVICEDIVSKKYIEMTLNLMSEYGIKSSFIGNNIQIKKQKYIAKDYFVESDWSSASFWFQIAALSKDCNILLNGLSKNSHQGDKIIMDLFKKLGVNSNFKDGKLLLTKSNNFDFPKKLNLIETPDLYQPIRCTLFAKNLNIEFLGIKHLKYKETDRLIALEKEIINLKNNKLIETHNEHRMAMCFAPLCLKYDEVKIKNIDVVKKSYPSFWKDLKKSDFTVIPLIDLNN